MAILRRADSEVQLDLLDELDRDPGVAVTDVGVEVNDGVVTLTGIVDTDAIKAAARGAALRVAGVRAVADEIVVRSGRPETPSDTDVARAVADALERLEGVPVERVEVRVEQGGQVFLQGALETAYQRDAVERAVRPVPGVVALVDLIRVTPTVASPEEIGTAIERALVQAARQVAARVQIQADDGVVRLTGTVRSAAERQDAEAAARRTRGVSAVENELRVGGEEAGAD